MTPYPHASTTPPAPIPAPAASARGCPRCRARLAVIQHRLRPAESLTTYICPSVTCGYKLIIPR